MIWSDFFWVEFQTDLIDGPEAFALTFAQIVSGNIRFLCKYGRRDRLPYHVILQRKEGGQWVHFAHHRVGLWRWRPRTEVVRNVPE